MIGLYINWLHRSTLHEKRGFFKIIFLHDVFRVISVYFFEIWFTFKELALLDKTRVVSFRIIEMK